jgi:RNA-directed DNA polymerase
MTATTVHAEQDVQVNGPWGEPDNWHQIDWDQAEQDVRRLRQRIFAAS